MPRTTGPYPLIANQPVIASPGSNAGNFSASAAVVINLSPFELVIGTGMSASQQLVDPVTRDLVPLDPQAGQQLTITPLAVGISPGGVIQQAYVVFYGVGESVPGSYPSSISQSGPSAYEWTTFNPIPATGVLTALGVASLPGIYRKALITFASVPGGVIYEIYRKSDTPLVLAQPFFDQPFWIPANRQITIEVPLNPQGLTVGDEILISLSGCTIVSVVLDQLPSVYTKPTWAQVPVPTFATDVAGGSAIPNGGNILPAPAYGAYYIFDISIVGPTGSNMTALVLQSFAGFPYFALIPQDGNANAMVNLRGKRNTLGIWGFYGANAPAAIAVGYAIGP